MASISNNRSLNGVVQDLEREMKKEDFNQIQEELRTQNIMDGEILGRFLVFAIKHQEEEMALQILERENVDLNVSDPNTGYSALNLSIYFKVKTLFLLLLNRKPSGLKQAEGRHIKTSSLFIAIDKECQDIALVIIEMMTFEELDKKNNRSQTPLSLSVRKGQPEVAKALMKKGVGLQRGENELIRGVLSEEDMQPFIQLIEVLSVRIEMIEVINRLPESDFKKIRTFKGLRTFARI